MGPRWMAQLAYGWRRPVVDGRRMDVSALAVAELVRLARPAGAAPLSVEASRRALKEMVARLDLPCPAGVQRRDVTLPGAAGPLAVRLYDTDLGASSRPALLYLHGGGWVQGDLDAFDGLCGELARAAGLRVISLDYRLAPEAPWPAAPDDVLAAWRALIADPGAAGIDPARLAVGGDSAGANLAAVLVHDLATAGQPGPAAQLLIYPALDLQDDTGSLESLREDAILPRRIIEWFLDLYLPPGADRTDPRIAPARSPHLHAAPPALILTAGHDPLRDQGAAHAARLRDAGVPVVLREYPGQIHAFLSLRRAIPEGRAALAEAAAWLAERQTTRAVSGR